jgi:hypothetical protein
VRSHVPVYARAVRKPIPYMVRIRVWDRVRDRVWDRVWDRGRDMVRVRVRVRDMVMVTFKVCNKSNPNECRY